MIEHELCQEFSSPRDKDIVFVFTLSGGLIMAAFALLFAVYDEQMF